MEQVEVAAVAPPHRGAAAVQVHALDGGEGLQGLEDFAITARVYVLLGEAGARGVDRLDDVREDRVHIVQRLASGHCDPVLLMCCLIPAWQPTRLSAVGAAPSRRSAQAASDLEHIVLCLAAGDRRTLDTLSPWGEARDGQAYAAKAGGSLCADVSRPCPRIGRPTAHRRREAGQGAAVAHCRPDPIVPRPNTVLLSTGYHRPVAAVESNVRVPRCCQLGASHAMVTEATVGRACDGVRPCRAHKIAGAPEQARVNERAGLVKVGRVGSPVEPHVARLRRHVYVGGRQRDGSDGAAAAVDRRSGDHLELAVDRTQHGPDERDETRQGRHAGGTTPGPPGARRACDEHCSNLREREEG
eukprot:scaffold80656_cov63-Phaeocystis_antarctica.AAC.3